MAKVFKLVTSTDPKRFEKKVNEYLAKGYKISTNLRTVTANDYVSIIQYSIGMEYNQSNVGSK